jgi:hypothetical protein
MLNHRKAQWLRHGCASAQRLIAPLLRHGETPLLHLGKKMLLRPVAPRPNALVALLLRHSETQLLRLPYSA